MFVSLMTNNAGRQWVECYEVEGTRAGEPQLGKARFFSPDRIKKKVR